VALVERDLDRATADPGLAFHISVHSFVERLGGEERRNHVGLLYGPDHPIERGLADRLHRRLQAAAFRVRRNYPYSGVDDGFCMRMRVEREVPTYLGMEIELNQRSLRRPDGARALGRALVAAFAPEFRASAKRG
jgi:predicted N-formylglutamate amidohydrolase